MQDGCQKSKDMASLVLAGGARLTVRNVGPSYCMRKDAWLALPLGSCCAGIVSGMPYWLVFEFPWFKFYRALVGHQASSLYLSPPYPNWILPFVIGSLVDHSSQMLLKSYWINVTLDWWCSEGQREDLQGSSWWSIIQWSVSYRLITGVV